MKERLLGLRRRITYYTDRRFTTIAGTLAYFLLMSIAPFTVWLTLLLGNADLSGFLSHSVFESISPFLNYLRESAQTAAGGAGIILLATSLYSSTNFFYHLRRSGEIIYGSRRVRGGIKLRVLSAALIIVTVLLTAFTAAFTITGRWFLGIFMPKVICDVISGVFAFGLAFAVCLLLNKFACPYALTFGEAIGGSALTSVLWALFIVGFGIYLKFGSPGKLYGAIASVIVFLLWCYFMMSCFVIGMIENGRKLSERVHKEYF